MGRSKGLNKLNDENYIEIVDDEDIIKELVNDIENDENEKLDQQYYDYGITSTAEELVQMYNDPEESITIAKSA